MYRLNLLPPEIKDDINYSKKNARLMKYLALSLSSFLIIVTIFVVLGISVKNEQKIAELEKSAAQQMIEEKSEVQKKAEDLAKRLKLIKSLKAERKDWPAILLSLSEKTPAGVQVDSLNISSKDKTRAKITGLAKSDLDIVLFKDLLGTSKYFGYVDIENISNSSDPSGRNIPTKTFSMTFSLKGAK